MFKLTVQYRTLQYLGILVNEILKTSIVTAMMICSIFTQAFSCVLLILMFDSHKTWIEFLMATVILGDSVPILVILVGGLARVWVISSQVLKNVRRHTLIRSTKCITSGKPKLKFLNSCSCIRVGFGDLNFVDQTTPLNCVDFANNLTVQLLLLRSKL